MSEDIFILGDADRVREQIERQLLGGNLAGVAKLSAKLAAGIVNLVRAAEESLEAETIMSGGDDVLFRVSSDAYSLEALKEISRHFRSETGCTISFGVGNEVALAYLNLRRAKAVGGGTIVATGEGAQ